MVNADAFEQCSVSFDGLFLVTHVQRQALARNLSAIDVHGEARQIVMAEIIRVRNSRTENVCVLYHGEYQTFREHIQHSVIDIYCLKAADIVEVLSSILLKLYRAMHLLLNAPVWA